MAIKRLVVIGGSAGGLEALRELVRSLPAEFPAPICVVLHTAPDAPGVLGSILSRSGRLAAENARDVERLKPGRIYVAPPDCHLLVEPGRVRVTKGPRENRFRPAIDPLFRSAAQVYGPAAIGVILTGNLGDGTAGLWAIKQLGGTTIVQDPDDALFPSMPRAALRQVQVDYRVPLAAVGPLLSRLTAEAVELPPPAVPAHMEVEVKIAKEHHPLDAGLASISEPSAFACPECHGVLLKLKNEGPIRFRCHTGHGYTLASLLGAVGDGVEDALWNAIRAFEEAEMLMAAMADYVEGHDAAEAATLRERAAEARRQSETLRQVALNREPLPVKR